VNDIEEWTAAQRRVIELTEGLDADRAALTVPACPAWTVRGLLSHMIGLGADVVRGDEPDDHNSTWTQRQVDERAGRDVPTLLAEWRALTEPLRAWMADHGTRPLADVIIHEQDLRGALGVPGARDTPGLAAVRDRFVDRFAARLGGLPPIALVGQHWRWASGDPPAVVLEADDFDLTRALLSRRSAHQLRTWTTRGDVTDHLAAFGALGQLPDTDLTE
jgi:uncharacterized protein (TIGR03083 family)